MDFDAYLHRQPSTLGILRYTYLSLMQARKPPAGAWVVHGVRAEAEGRQSQYRRLHKMFRGPQTRWRIWVD
jgi:hypothetical protein